MCGRLWTLREEKKLSQGDIEKRTGLLRCYISRVEKRPELERTGSTSDIHRGLNRHDLTRYGS